MKAASSLVRNDSAPTRSSGNSGRLIACSVATALNSSSMVAKPGRGLRTSVPGERVSPDAMALTVMRRPRRRHKSAMMMISENVLEQGEHVAVGRRRLRRQPADSARR